MTMRATQKKMMSKPVISTDDGTNCWNSCHSFARSGVSPGQPSVENGHNADENHVSSTSGSRVSWPTGFVVECATASASSSPTKMCPTSSYHAGIWWPHHSWRDTHQSWMFSSHCTYVVAQFSGTK